MTVVQDEQAHRHVCPLCDKEYYCTDTNCTGITYIQCQECWEGTVTVQ